MLIGIDDTDSPAGMCTTYLGAVLARRLIREHMRVREARLVRLNPNVTFKTRGNAAIMLDVDGDPDRAFAIASGLVEELADFSCSNTNPGLVVSETKPDREFYRKAVTDFCTIDEATALLEETGARYRGWKNRRGLIGATAAVASEFPDRTSEILVYREPARFGTPRTVDRQSLFDAETATFPHTWDTVDTINDVVVCVPHTPDPVLFGIRGESPQWVMAARQMIESEKPGIEQIWVTNQGTDAHLLSGITGQLQEGLSYRVRGTVADVPKTGTGGHVSFMILDRGNTVRCMAYEPTKNFRHIVRQLLPGDEIVAAGSYKKGSINLEKMKIISLVRAERNRPPLCPACSKRMTSDGRGKGWKCKKCGARADAPDVQEIRRTLKPGWYEVPPTARRHLARPLCRGLPEEL
ncbi:MULTISPECIES: tRNA(Ile)(2)-agmatinylcytidine synthase [unclassified Methanoregula]|uniref:tRNA(Ile)(2)-agmatinylcytidine synthase n=1 Tax=unclassified Methanoregula TaxID=2649730 RepID=UPI0009D14BA1|nr:MULTISPECIES: tRNA(Ile)(2)-agmatinylcytidine synthase [unclassified Methanoregula]OPX61760.1 MAG: tRNA(Ile2) 2-agmatinylcytidine synthetase TiaS [Methanoregula sp. PtaB.Bin085]OPY33931.1 MAG: tRNA(Ile2) 2-agmatinylcytidine synthetase TiaS [Methanoregula sp. PtaU1.Bin006]